MLFLVNFSACSRETGGLNRIIDRGSRAINFILSAMVFNVVPTILEVIFFYIFIYFMSVIQAVIVTASMVDNKFYFTQPLFKFIPVSFAVILTCLSYLISCNICVFRFRWQQVFSHTNLEHHLHGSLLCPLLHMLPSH